MRRIGILSTEGPRDERASGHVSWPGLPQSAREGEQDRARRQRDHRFRATHHISASVHDKRVRRQERFDLLQRERLFLATRIRRAAGVFRTRVALSTSAVSVGMSAAHAPAWPAPVRRAPSAFEDGASRSPRPPTHGPRATRAETGWVNPGEHALGPPRRPISSSRRTSRVRAWAAFTRSP